jgi:alpha-beta hydrolase superfamily lysophospholipase
MSVASGLDSSGLSHDLSVIEAYNHDPLVHDKITLCMGNSLNQAIEFAFDHAREFTAPLLLMHGEKDALAFPSSSYDFGKLVEGDLTLKVWPEKFHELHNETGKEEVLEFMAAWLKAKMPAPALDNFQNQ